jgi:hypothetical protein
MSFRPASMLTVRALALGGLALVAVSARAEGVTDLSAGPSASVGQGQMDGRSKVAPSNQRAVQPPHEGARGDSDEGLGLQDGCLDLGRKLELIV